MNKELHGVVLAGGLASRMGFPKALAPVEGSFFLRQIYDRLTGAGAIPVHVVANTGLASLLEARMSEMPAARVVPNPEPSRGQISSLQLGLAAARSAGAGGALAALVDQPWVRADTMRVVAQRFPGAPDRILIPRHGGRTGHPFLIPAECFDFFLNAGPGETAKDVIQRWQERVQYVDVDDAAILRDADSLADWPPKG